ncbi:MAG: ChaN family lipoprotein [Verrucomicrobia bacterium]|nr:ChaN family lipoprotein [Verrucomicrobiota bacterium]
MKPALPLCAALLSLFAGCATAPRPVAGPLPSAPPEFWLDLARGDEVPEADVLADLATAGAIFVGEAHTIPRHHALQLHLLQELFSRQVPLVLCLEQLEARDQPAVDRYTRRELDFDGLVRAIDWPKKWSNYADYRALCEFARQHRIPIRALNAPSDTIRTVSRGGGIAKLPPDLRAHLPTEIFLEEPVYERLTTLELATHMAMDPARLRPVFEAQVARDETMAVNIVAARRIDTAPDKPRTAFVIVGAGHMRFGLGTADRVRRRDPGIVERLVILTESDQLRLTAAEKAASRDVTISHAELRVIGRPPADYVRILPRSASKILPPGHPPIP